MDIKTAQANIGRPFKWNMLDRWDTIRRVTEDGMIIGDVIEAPVEDCRLKQPQPTQFQKPKEKIR